MLQFLFIVLVLYWANILFFSAWYMLFLCFFTGIILDFTAKKTSPAFKFVFIMAVNLIFSYSYMNLLNLRPPSESFYINFLLFENIKRNILENITVIGYLYLAAPLLGVFGVFAARALKKLHINAKNLALIFLMFFCLNFYSLGLGLNFNGFSDTRIFPPAGKYSFDGHVYLRTFHLMKAGNSYYKSIDDSIKNRAGGYSYSSYFNIRPPFIFYFWKLLALNGFYIALLFIIFSIILFFIVFYTVDYELKNPLLSLIAPVLLSPLFIYGLSANWYTFHEYWGWFFLGISLWAKQIRNNILWILFLTLCVMTRELFFIVWALIFITALLNKEKDALKYLIFSFLIIAAYYLLHFYMIKVNIFNHLPLNTPGVNITPWLHIKPDFSFAKNAFFFCSIFIFKPVLFGMFLIICHILSSIRIFRDKLTLYYPLIILPLLGILYLFVSIPPVTYWGLLYLPAFAYVIPFAFYQNHKLD